MVIEDTSENNSTIDPLNKKKNYKKEKLLFKGILKSKGTDYN